MTVTFTSDLFKWPSKVGPSSAVIKNPKDWQDEGILVPHEAFRWYHKCIREILPKMKHGDAWRLELFQHWFKTYYLEALHHHHDSEENIYNPAIKERGGRLPPNIVTDHKTIMDDIEKILAYLDKIHHDKSVIPEFCTFTEKFTHDVDGHLADEERNYPRALRETGMTHEEEQQIIAKLLQSAGLGGNKVLLPPIVYAMCMWKGEPGMQEFASQIPPPIRLLAQNCWIPEFYHQNLCVIEALKGDEPFHPETPQCGLCVLQ